MITPDITASVALGKDVLLAVVGVIGAVVAVRGLRTWNRQLKGGVEYELTRRLLRNAYRLREAMVSVRAPFMSTGEMPAPPESERTKMTREQILHYGSARGYEKRWEPVASALGDLRADLLEAEVIWSKDVHLKFDPLFKLQRELFVAVHMYLRATDPTHSEATRENLHADLQKRRDVLFGMPGVEDDTFAKDVSAAISVIEGFLKPHLRR